MYIIQPSLVLVVSCYLLPVSSLMRLIPNSWCHRLIQVQWNRVVLFSTGGDVDPDPSFSKFYRLDGVGHRSRVDITTNTGHQLKTDVPKKMGGSDTAPQPVEMLLSAWMGCTQATAVFVGRHMSPRIMIESLEFEGIQAVRDERGALMLPIEEQPSIPSRLQYVTGVIKIQSRNNTPLTKEQIQLLQEQTEVRCPVANMMIASGCTMDVKWIDATDEEA
jgi:putative redox protein